MPEGICSVSEAVRVLEAFDFSWFGPPLALYQATDQVVDGRMRHRAAQQLATARGVRVTIPQVRLRSAPEVVRFLVAAGHIDRAVQWICPSGSRLPFDRDDLAAYGLDASDEARILGHFRRELPRRKHRQPRRALSVVARVRDLYRLCSDEAYRVTADDLREALGEWIV